MKVLVSRTRKVRGQFSHGQHRNFPVGWPTIDFVIMRMLWSRFTREDTCMEAPKLRIWGRQQILQSRQTEPSTSEYHEEKEGEIGRIQSRPHIERRERNWDSWLT